MTDVFDKVFSEKLSAIIAITSLICFFVAIFVFLFYGSWQFSQVLDESKVGQFGDFIGGVVGTLLAFVAAILYYVALKEQRKDIKINQTSINLQNEALGKQIEEFEKQKEELALARNVYEQQYKTMKEQEHTMKIQQFESSFYSFLNVYITIKNELNNNDQDKDFFKTIFIELKNSVNDNLVYEPFLRCHQIVEEKYIELFLHNKGKLSHYFKTVYRLLKIIDSSVYLNPKEKIFYTKIIRSQLTDYELLIMYYNYHSVYAKKAINLIYKYNILKHVHPLSKIEFNNKYGITTENNYALTAFLEGFSILLEKTINQFCDSFEFQEIQEEYSNLSVIVSISYTEAVSIKISCLNKMLIPENFEQIIYDYLFDKLFVTQFKKINNEFACRNYTEEEGIVSFEYILNEQLIQKLNKDTEYDS